MTSLHLLRKLGVLMQGKIYKIMKILGRMNSRTVMMERFQDAEFSWHCCPQKTVTIPKSVCVLYLLFTQPSLIRSFHSSDPCFSVSCPKGVENARVYCIPEWGTFQLCSNTYRRVPRGGLGGSYKPPPDAK